MFPVALRLGGLTITWYGVLAAVGFFVAVRWVIGRARKDGLSVAHVEWLAFWIIVSAIVGSRGLFVLTQLPHFLEHPGEVFLPRDGGLVFLGGLVAAFATGVIYVRVRGLPMWRYADVVLPGVALGHAFGRIGCFAVGCCFGRPAPELAWAVSFPQSAWRQIAPAGEALHPTQLYEAGTNLLIFAALLVLHPRRRFDGQVALAYLGLYAASRIVLEIFRGDGDRGFLFEGTLGPAVSTSQFIAGLVLAATAAVYIRLRRRGSPPTAPSPGPG